MLHVPILLLLCACVGSQSQNINNENAFDYVKVVRGNSVNGDTFFESATNKPLGKCLTDFSSCTHKQLSLGNQIDVQLYQVRLLGNNMTVTHPMDKLFVAAAMVAQQEGYKFITPIYEVRADSYTEEPTSYDTNCYSLYGSVYCTTDGYTKKTYWQEYDIEFIAYNNYDNIKNGVLYIDVDKENKGLPVFSLYRTQTSEHTQNDSNSHYSMIGYANAWKTKYDVTEILNGEQVEPKQFDIQHEQITKYKSVQDKYKQ